MPDNRGSDDVAGRKPVPFAANQPLQFAQPSGLGSKCFLSPCARMRFYRLRANLLLPAYAASQPLSRANAALSTKPIPERCASLRARLACRSDALQLAAILRVQRPVDVALCLNDAD